MKLHLLGGMPDNTSGSAPNVRGPVALMVGFVDFVIEIKHVEQIAGLFTDTQL
jgi:hypothetical protein